jgi:hypothetical protein
LRSPETRASRPERVGETPAHAIVTGTASLGLFPDVKTDPFEIETSRDSELTPTSTDSEPIPGAPAAVALALAAGHLIEAGVHAHRFMNLSDAARRLGISRGRATHLASLMPLAPEIQTEMLALNVGDPLAKLSERALHELVNVHDDWRVQRWWWSVLTQPFKPDWLVDGVPPRTAFPSGARARGDDQAIGDLPLAKLADLVARRRGHRDTPFRREALLAALANAADAPTMLPNIARVLSMPADQLEVEYQRLHGHRPFSRHPEYVRRRVAWAIQAEKLGGLPKPIAGKVMELRDHLPNRWREAFAGIARIHITRLHRVDRRSAA